MTHAQRHALSRTVVALLVMVVFSTPAGAVDGVIEINQASALAGNVAIGDSTPGFPVTLTAPGSYRLTSNLAVANAATNVIEITGNDVTLDLNGFTIQGPVVCGGTPLLCNNPGGGSISGSRAS